MISALDMMALGLLTQLTARGFPAPSLVECKNILRDVIDEAAGVAEDMERQTKKRAPA